jgi:hypothetical protein
MELTRALRGPRRESLAIGLIRGCFGIETLATGCAGVIALMYAFLVFVAAIVSGWRYALLVLALTAIALLLVGSAVGLAWLGSRTLAAPIGRSWLVAVAVQLALAAIGIRTATWIAPYASDQTEGPFADGVTGTIGLLAYVYAGCGVFSLSLFVLEATRQGWRRLKTA